MAEALPVRDGGEEGSFKMHEDTSECNDRLQDLTGTLQSSTSYESLHSAKRLQRETDAQKLKYKANSR